MKQLGPYYAPFVGAISALSFIFQQTFMSDDGLTKADYIAALVFGFIVGALIMIVSKKGVAKS